MILRPSQQFRPYLRSLLVCLAIVAAAGAAQPDYLRANQFAAALQKDYQAKQHRAIIERLDSQALRSATFLVFGRDALQSPAVHLMWDKTLWPAIHRELQGCDTMPHLQPGRVLMLEGQRVIECVLTNDTGNFQVLRLWLNAGNDGTIRICDLQFLGQRLELSRRLRHLFLLLGAPFSAKLDEEEQNLAIRSPPYQATFALAMRNLEGGDTTAAYKIWRTAPPEIQSTRIWQDIRDRMGFAGAAAAMEDILISFKQGTLNNPLLCLTLARQLDDPKRTLAAMDMLIESQFHQPFLITVKADFLRQFGDLVQALALARSVYNDYPHMLTAYVVAIYVEVQLGQTDAALGTVKRAHAVFPAETLDTLLRTDPALAPLTTLPAYLTWHRQALSTAEANAVNAPRPRDG